jgi:putative transcriptional regulator
MKAELFAKLVGAVDEAVAHHRGAKLNLRTTKLPDPPDPVTSKTVKQVRHAANVSQAVFARYLNVSTKTVQAWEGGTRPVAGPALLLFRIAKQHPGVVFPGSTGASSGKGMPSVRGRRMAGGSVAAAGSKRR